MEDKNGTKIWDGDYVVGVTASGEVRDGIVTGKYPAQMTVRITDDNGDDAWLKNYRTEVQPTESRNYRDAWCDCPESQCRPSPIWSQYSQQYNTICENCKKFLAVG